MLSSLSWQEGPCGAGTQTSEVGALAGAGVWSREGQHEAGSGGIGRVGGRETQEGRDMGTYAYV